MIKCQKLKCILRKDCVSKYIKNFKCKHIMLGYTKIPMQRRSEREGYYERLNSDW